MIQRPRVVIIDDDPSYREPIASHLSKDFQVTTASCGQEGVSRMLTTRPDGVVFGLAVRSCDGLQTLRSIAKNSKLREIPLLVLAPPPASIEDLWSRGFRVDDLLIKDRTVWMKLTPRLLGIVSRKGGMAVTEKTV